MYKENDVILVRYNTLIKKIVFYYIIILNNKFLVFDKFVKFKKIWLNPIKSSHITFIRLIN